MAYEYQWYWKNWWKLLPSWNSWNSIEINGQIVKVTFFSFGPLQIKGYRHGL